MADSASANPPNNGPTSSDLTGLYFFISSTSSSSDIQPSEIGWVPSTGGCFVLFDSSCVGILARTSWYRNSLASWPVNIVTGARGTFGGIMAKISTRWLTLKLVENAIIAVEQSVQAMYSLCAARYESGRNAWSIRTWTSALRPFAKPPSPFELLVDLREWYLKYVLRNCHNVGVHHQKVIFGFRPTHTLVSDSYLLYVSKNFQTSSDRSWSRSRPKQEEQLPIFTKFSILYSLSYLPT